ncbi:hypothetical protein AeMF1_002425 [Aphanomyces euteiches]|nr:hypothetical protein AeMF1_002425 [Aphanomyces euteiches]KAH9188944.1 hypothetical protein AeNC1_009080 [Aphanomyces euteiches]
MSPSLKVIYFDMAGRAETTRLALHVGGIPFEDERIAREAWPELKPTLPYKQLPVLTVDGQVFSQSHAMARYAGVLSGLYPKDNAVDALRVDELCDFNEDILLAVVPTFREQDAEKRKAMSEDLAANKLPEMLAMLEARLAASKGPFVLDSISLADLSIYSTVSMFQSGWLENIPTDLCDKYAKIMAIYDAVSKHPKIVEWNEAHKK